MILFLVYLFSLGMLKLSIVPCKVLRAIHRFISYNRGILISPFDKQLILAEAYDYFKLFTIAWAFALSGDGVHFCRRYLIALALICALVDTKYAPGLTLQEVRTQMPPTDVIVAFRVVLWAITRYFESIIIIDGALGSDTFAALR